ncbi:hypothetical protein MNBD_CHLOROFLEXI01-4616 [hydrothermal vent metagenome]|uniref:Uncharacterized protein n=1 Tax=hydrothermal vent metagenome TaxID=652676 RepID=A0A3B0V7E8_9ZZZZ
MAYWVLPRVVAYVLNQQQHHADGDLWTGLERIEASDKGV